MKYLVLGVNGMAGHLIAQYLLENDENVEGIARNTSYICKTHIMDVTDFNALKRIIDKGNYDIIINCIGILNKNAEQNIAQAILINSYLPHFLVDVTENIKTKIIHMSTDCVFSGTRGLYTENDFPDGQTVYDRTKALGEINDDKNLTFRNSIIGPDINDCGSGLFNWFMKQEGTISGYAKSKWTGVTTLILAKAIHKASYEGLSGLYNLVNNETTNKYELLLLLNKYSKKELKINKVAGINLDKSLYRTRNDFSFKVPSYEEQVKEMFLWIDSHKDIYKYGEHKQGTQ